MHKPITVTFRVSATLKRKWSAPFFGWGPGLIDNHIS